MPSSVWVYAHLSQFAAPSWRYLHSTGNGFLAGGGSYCALVSRGGAQLSLLIETTAPQQARVHLRLFCRHHVSQAPLL